MSVQSHLEALQKKHSNLEDQIRETMLQPASDSAEIALLKRRKLRLKDEMNQLERQTEH